jgi:hypothetical protein
LDYRKFEETFKSVKMLQAGSRIELPQPIGRIKGSAMLESGSDRDRFWLDTMEDTISMVRIISHDRTLLLMLAGAVFALHQDMLKARVDMRNLGVFSERVRPMLNALYDIDDNNLDVLHGSHPAECAQTSQTHMISARLRSAAARIRLLTLHARVGEGLGITAHVVTILNLGVGNLWMMLGVVRAEDLRETATFFAGSYFEGVRSKPMKIKDWPYHQILGLH